MKRTKIAGVVLVTGLSLVSGTALAATLSGTGGADDIDGTSGRDRITAFAGNDEVHARRGNDRVWQYGRRRIVRSDNDRLVGGDGDDNITANDGGRDEILCGEDEDFVYADPNDVVYHGCETVRIDR